MKPAPAAAWVAALALLAGCSSVSIGVGLPIGRAGGIYIGGSVPLPSPAASAPPATASAPGP